MKQNYQLGKKSTIIGCGSYGKVFKTQWTKDPDSKVAIKVINKAMLVNCLDSVMKEVMILTQVDHPCIVKYFETYDDKMFLYLVMEYIQG